MKKLLTNVLLTGCAGLFVLALAWFCAGSLETFPTPEQTEKARIAAALLTGASGAALWLVWRARKKR